jgi:PDZ domain-containing secreted protein
MITATKDDPSDDPGVTLVEYQSKRKTEIYVADIRRGPFFKTHLYKGDKILSVNGKKHPKELKTAEQAQDLLESKLKATVFAIRPDPEKDDGYKWVMENC